MVSIARARVLSPARLFNHFFFKGGKEDFYFALVISLRRRCHYIADLFTSMVIMTFLKLEPLGSKPKRPTNRAQVKLFKKKINANKCGALRSGGLS